MRLTVMKNASNNSSEWTRSPGFVEELSGRDHPFIMAYRCHLNATRAILIVSCLAAIGYYVLAKQDVFKILESVKLRNFSDTKPKALDDVINDNSDVKTSEVIYGNSTLSTGRTAKQIAVEAERIDTEKYERIGIEKHMIDLHSVDPHELMNWTVIVTAISQNHFKESKGMVGSVQEFLPNTRIIMYDLGLNPSGANEVQRLCNVELRRFNFSMYPPHVKDLHKYAWKPLIIRDTLDEFGVVFWCDASARFRKDPIVLFSLLKGQSGFMRRVVEFKPTKILARTHPEMFEKLGVDREKFRADYGYAMCFEANRLLFVNSALIHANIILPWVDCAMKRDCISPEGSVLGMNEKGPTKYTHRFDQAALALIAYKNMRGVWNAENDKSKLFHDVVGLARSSQSGIAKFCRQ